jgi:hypothetical protein
MVAATIHVVLNPSISLVISATAPQVNAGVPESIKRVGQADVFPNEYPGQVYAFNWCLNGDGVTPLRKSAFRITKTLDLKVAGLDVPKQIPLNVSFLINCLTPRCGLTLNFLIISRFLAFAGQTGRLLVDSGSWIGSIII